jgi:hypothetical protein
MMYASGSARAAGRARWFELSEEGWRRENRARPLGQLLREALQNAFDHSAPGVWVRIGPSEIWVEDDAAGGLAQDEYAFTVFLGEKDTPPTWRGRKGRGLKELIASSDSAEVETVGRTIIFGPDGRSIEENRRDRGTLIVLRRRVGDRERAEAERLLRLTIPPEGTRVRVNGREVRRPRLFQSLEGCDLETVDIRRGSERAMDRECRVDLYRPRPGEVPHLFELGLPIEPLSLPWHADVQQRIPLAAERDAARDPYKPDLCALVFEALAAELTKSELEQRWVAQVLGRYELSEETIRAYARKMFPARAVLSAGGRIDDRARQLGAKVVELRGVPAGFADQLASVLETADEFVERVQGPPREVLVDLGERADRFVEFARWLSREVSGRDVRVEFFDREARDGRALVDAEFERFTRTLRINVRGRVRVEDPTHPASLETLLHELAHDASAEHDFAFISRLEAVAARAVIGAFRSHPRSA